MSSIKRWMDRKLYPDFVGNWDNKRYREYILMRLKEDQSILDYGAGRGYVSEMNFKGNAKFVAGVDVDTAVMNNPFLNEAKLLELPEAKIPYPEEYFDLVFCNNVLEHIEHPDSFLQEAFRVLKAGGVFLCKTPNKYHYIAGIAKFTPHSFHQFINKKFGREGEDTFPTFYRCNTPKDIKQYARKCGFKVVDIQTWEGHPGYLRRWTVTYFFGFLYERAVNKFSFLQKFRSVLVSTLEKPS